MTYIEFNIVSICPEMFKTSLNESILKKAQKKSLFKINLFNLRDFAEGKHKVTDDYPYGGGGGRIMKPEPLVKAIETISAEKPTSKVILMTAQGETLYQVFA